MADILGTDIPTPTIDFTGFFSSTWIYVLIIIILGVILIASVGLLLYFRTYNRKVVVFENISGQGYQPVLKTRARILRVGNGGEELLKTLSGGHYLSAYGRKMGKNTFWYAKGQDGYLYNILLGDLDAKMGMLDIEPVERDVRMFRIALDRISKETYGKQSFFEKYAVQMLLFLFLIALVVSMWVIIGKVGEATSALAATADTNEKVVSNLNAILGRNEIISTGGGNLSGIVPVS